MWPHDAQARTTAGKATPDANLSIRVPRGTKT